MNDNTDTPQVSVIMANLNGAAHIAAAVRSVLRQTERSLELIVSDDGSTDDSIAIAGAAAGGDPRLVVVTSAASRTGPAAARNRALDVARGRWIAIVDNDDYIHPERLERMIADATRERADIAADDLLTFYEDGSRAPHGHLKARDEPRWISAADYERSNRLLSGRRALGYLKPIIRRSLAPRYDESLRIAEDSDLVLRLLANGARMRLYPELGYFYRKHAASVSHRLDAAAIDAMDAANRRLEPDADADLVRELRASRAAFADARAFTKLIDALKARDIGGAISTAASRPTALRLLKDPIAARLPKLGARRPVSGKAVTLVSRQRIVGATNGSSAYVLALAGALKSAGYAVDYIGASPKIFGRWAVLRLKPETAVFRRYLVHGGVRLGNVVIASDPRIWLSSFLAVASSLLGRVGVRSNLSKPAEAAQSAKATRADQLFVARNAAPNAEAVICDYAFLTPLAPFALAEKAPRLVIMHDLMSARIKDATKADDYTLTAAEEIRLLGQADIVVAIQEDEAKAVRAALPNNGTIVAAHAVTVAPAPEPGADDALLFVGSNTPPNVTGLEWFFAKSWPAIRARRPNAKLIVAGSVNRAFSAAPSGVTFLGVVTDLAPLYRDAGVIISPLVTGSGLKIKLIEAMAAGKAVVGTTVTAQGVHHLISGAVLIEDDPARFADSTARLMADRSARQELGAKARACAAEHFSPEACFRDFIAAIRAGAAPSAIETDDCKKAAQSNLRSPASASQ